MELRVPSAGLERIRAHARETYPEECCGFLIGEDKGATRVVTEIRPTRNVHPGPRSSRYAIENEATRRIEAEFRVGDVRLLGFYHSHPNVPPAPSEFDRRTAWEYYVYAILAVDDGVPGEFVAWSFDWERREFETVPVLVDRPS